MDDKDLEGLIKLDSDADIKLDSDADEIANKIMQETDDSSIKNLTHLFNLNQAKKNALRILKLNSLLDKVSDQMIERFEQRPGEFSNNDLLNYMTVVQSSIDRANKQLNLIDEMPAITLNQVNVNMENMLDRESRSKITEAVNKILQMASAEEKRIEDIVIEPEIVEETTLENKDNLNDIKLNEEED